MFVTLEKVSSSQRFNNVMTTLYNSGYLARFVVDEAHCICEWGYDFRSDYLKLSLLRSQYPKVPIMALTATATERVRMDIVKKLKLTNCKWFLGSFNRSNLQYSVKTKVSGVKAIEEIKDLIKTEFPEESGIVYCLSRRECDEMTEHLKSVNCSIALQILHDCKGS